MSYKKVVFDYFDGGVSRLEMDIVKLLVEDDEFFKKIITIIDPNTFDFGCARLIVGMMKDGWLQEGIKLSPEVILYRLKRKESNGWDYLDAEEYFKEISERVLDDNRIAEVKSEAKYMSLFKMFAYATNHAKDTLYSDGISNFSKLKLAAEQLVKDAERVKDALDRMEPEGAGINDWS